MASDPRIGSLLSAAPFFDDFSAADNYYRILFRPAVAIQARELTAAQDILQNQISDFADTIYKSGSIVSGCSIEFIPDIEWVMIADTFTTNSALAQDDPELTGSVIVGANSGVQAYLVATASGFAAQNPGKFFIRYTAPGSNNVTRFSPGELLNVYSSNTSYIEDVVLQCNSAVSYFATGQAVLCTQASNTANVLATALIVSTNTSACTVTVNNIQAILAANTMLVLQANSQVTAGISTIAYNTGPLIGSINVLSSSLTSNSAFANNDALGYAYGAYVSDGVIYQSGFFVNVDRQTIIVNSANSNPANFQIGFATTPSIVNQFIDPSLNDNALGYSNYNAPGAYRLKLTANLMAWTANQVSSNTNLFPIVQFSNSGVVFENTDSQYSTLGDALARRTYDEAGHFIISPFIVTANTNVQDANSVMLTIHSGLAYVEGERIELLNSLDIAERRGTDTVMSLNNIVTTTYGNYVEVDEVRGLFQTQGDAIVNLYDTAQHAVSGNYTTPTTPTGTLIGTAALRAMVSPSTLQGTPSSPFNMYLFNIQMLSGASFASVKSIVNANNTAFADIESLPASLVDAAFTPLIFSLGSSATKSLSTNGAFNSNYYYIGNAIGSSTYLDSTGKITFTVPTGGGEFGVGAGLADTAELSRVTVMVLANTISSNLVSTANVYANGLVQCSQANFGSSIFYPGCMIGTPGGSFGITASVNSTALQTTATAAQTNVAVWRIETAGSVIPLDGITRTLTFSNATSAFANLGLTYRAQVNAAVSFYAYNSLASQTSKTVHRDTTVLIKPSANGTDVGPWSVGLPDVLNMTAVYTVANVAGVLTPQTSVNVISDFVLDNGQRDGYYDLASVSLSQSANVAAYANQMLVVMLDHFTVANTASGGYFSVDSFDINDTATANVFATIATAEIPSYYSTSQQKLYNLRDCVDFRPYKVATANVGNAISTATLNPTTSSAFNTGTSGFTPYPSGNFICNLTQYIGRNDVLLLSSSGDFNIAEGTSGTFPQYPSYDSNTNLSIAQIVVPPYPSLPSNEVQAFPNASKSYDMQIILQNHRRYTMNDISSLDKRISQLEYYTTLNTLENAAATTTSINASGLTQFQNGIFVDPINNFSFSNVQNPQYTMAIDSQHGFGRPQFIPWYAALAFDSTKSTNVQKTGNFITIGYTSEPFIQQTYASDNRALSGMPPSYIGTMAVYPSFWSDIEAISPPASSTSDGSPASAALANMTVPAFTLTYGWWRNILLGSGNYLTASNSAIVAISSSTSIGGSSNSPSTYALNDTTQVNVSLQAYVSPREIAFATSGLKPYTRFNLYIDTALMNALSAPGVLNSNGIDDNTVTRSEPWGSQLVSDSSGNLYGKVSIPSMTLSVGSHTVTLLDASIDSVTSSQVSAAIGAFSSSITYNPPPKPVVVLSPPVSTGHAQFTLDSSQADVVSPANPLISVTDTSVADPSIPISTWLWSWGDGTTQVTTTPGIKLSHTYNNVSYNLETIGLSIAAANGSSAGASTSSQVWLNVTAPAYVAPAPVTAPNTPSPPVTVVVPHTVTIVGSVNGLGMVTGSTVATGTANLVLTASVTNYNASTGSISWSVPPTASYNTVGAHTLASTATYKESGTALANAAGSYTITVQAAVVHTGGGGCADVVSYTPYDKRIGEYNDDDHISVCKHADLSLVDRVVKSTRHSMQPCTRITMQNGFTVILSNDTMLEGANGIRFLVGDSLGKAMPVWDGDIESIPEWSIVKRVDAVPDHEVNHISLKGNDRCYWAGEQDGRYISIHNKEARYYYTLMNGVIKNQYGLY